MYFIDAYKISVNRVKHKISDYQFLPGSTIMKHHFFCYRKKKKEWLGLKHNAGDKIHSKRTRQTDLIK